MKLRPMPATRKGLKGVGKMRPVQTPNYLGKYNKRAGRARHAFRVPTIGGDFGA